MPLRTGWDLQTQWTQAKLNARKRTGGAYNEGENESSRYYGVDERFDRHESERYLIGHSVSNGGLHSP